MTASPLQPTPEHRNVDAAYFQNEIVPAHRPAILRGLVDRWPAVQHAKASAQDVCRYLGQFYQGQSVPLLIGAQRAAAIKAVLAQAFKPR